MKSLPFVTRLRLAWQMLRSSKAVPTPVRRRKPSSKKSPSEWQPSAKQPDNYVYLSGFVLLPDEVLPLLSHAVKLDYDYVGSDRDWKLHKQQSINVEFWSAKRVNALRIAEKLEGS